MKRLGLILFVCCTCVSTMLCTLPTAEELEKDMLEEIYGDCTPTLRCRCIIRIDSLSGVMIVEEACNVRQ